MCMYMYRVFLHAFSHVSSTLQVDDAYDFASRLLLQNFEEVRHA